MSVNIVHLLGRLGQDVEIKYGQSGTAYAILSVATDESYTDKQGNKVKDTTWHKVTVYNKTAENCAKYLAKGSEVFVEGSIRTNKYTDKQGVERTGFFIRANRVDFVSSKRSEGGNGSYQNEQSHQERQTQRSAPPAPAPQEPMGGFAVGSESMDEVPF